MSYEESDEPADEPDDETADGRYEAEEHGGEEGFGDDFDDFEAGAEGQDFGEFDDGFQEPEEPLVEAEKLAQPDPSSLSHFVSRFSRGNQNSRSHVAHPFGSVVMLTVPLRNP